MAQFLRPDGNITQASFTGGFADIDEASPSDADYAYGANNTDATLEVSVSNPAGAPGSGTCTLRWRIAKTNNGTIDGSGSALTVTAAVYEGASAVATGGAETPTGTWTQYNLTFDASLVADWNDLRIRWVTSASGGSPANRRGGAISWAELEVPDADVNRTGTGAVSIGPPALSGSGTITAPAISGTGAVAISGPALAGTGSAAAPSFAGTGAVAIGPPAVSGTGARTLPAYSGTAAVGIGGPSLAAAGTVVVPGILGYGARVKFFADAKTFPTEVDAFGTGNFLTLGMSIKALAACSVLGVRVYNPQWDGSPQTLTISSVSLWDRQSGSSLAVKTIAAGERPTTEGWFEFLFDAPVPLSVFDAGNPRYVVAYTIDNTSRFPVERSVSGTPITISGVAETLDPDDGAGFSNGTFAEHSGSSPSLPFTQGGSRPWYGVDAVLATPASVTVGGPSVSGTGAVAEPGFSGAGAVTIGGPVINASGTATAPSFTGSGAVTIGAPAVGGTGTATPPAVVGAGAVVVSGPILSGAGAAAAAGVSGAAAVLISGPSVSGSGTRDLPVFAGAGAVVLGAPMVAASGVTTVPGILGVATVVVAGPGLAGSGVIAPPTISGAAAVTIGGPAVAAVGILSGIGAGAGPALVARLAFGVAPRARLSAAATASARLRHLAAVSAQLEIRRR